MFFIIFPVIYDVIYSGKNKYYLSRRKKNIILFQEKKIL
jgi:hypothetical protein